MNKSPYKTRQQEQLLSYLEEHKGEHFTAEDVRLHFAQKEISLGTATIYRHLERLVGEGCLNKYVIDEHSAACFEYTGGCKGPQEEQHFHLKCEGCGCLIHLECDELCQIRAHLLKSHGFELNPLRTVFYGLCADCRQKASETGD
ncbi:MAG: transcriptional repressor [Treponema sp.]|nr:transcriptional repressor [Treponema sp.]